MASAVDAKSVGVSSRLEGLGKRQELPSGARDRAPAENGFWAYF